MRTVAIAGVGLIGGSFALAVRKTGFDGLVLGVRSRSSEKALALGVIDEAVSLEDACQADLLYLAQPVGVIIETLERIAGKLKTGCIVTDAGSTKVEICRRASELGIHSFIGGHPMAGKEVSGVESAEADLFVDRTYVLTPPHDLEVYASVYSRLQNLISRIGSKVTLLSAGDHDRIVGFTSHLPQVLSSALALTIQSEDFNLKELGVAGSGLRDTTRLALSSYEVWGDILRTNQEVIDRALARYIDKLNFFRQNLTNPDLSDEFEKASRLAAILRRSSEL